MKAEEQIAALGLTLPPAPPRGGVYKPVVVVGNIAYVSGHGPYLGEGDYITGRVGDDLDLAQGNSAARQTGLAHRTALEDLRQLESLGLIRREGRGKAIHWLRA